MPTSPSTALRLGAVLLCLLGNAAHADPCGDKFGASSFEGNRCRDALADAQDAALETYLQAAEAQVSKMTEDLPPVTGMPRQLPDLRAAQKTWEAYRTVQCGDVYLFWIDGTYRYEAAFACHQQLARERMHDLWLAYLTFLDGAPPVLPEP